MQQAKKTKGSGTDKAFKEIMRRLDVLVVVHLAKSGLTRKEIADVLGVSEDTIERMLPFKKLKSKVHEE